MTSTPPPQLTYATNTYFTLSAPPSSLVHLLPSDDSASSSSQSSSSSTSSTLLSSLTYVGTVAGGDHIFSVSVPSAGQPRPGITEVQRWLEGVEGVEDVELMVPRRRNKGTMVV